jgi:hypothetical protein
MNKLIVASVLSLYVCSAGLGQTKTRQYPSITWKQFLASGPNLKQIGWLAVRHSREIASSPWSVGCETLDRDQAKFSVYKDYVGELGVKHGRLQSGWAKCEKQRGVYDFAWLDECVYGLNEQGVKPWVCLCYGNPLYGSSIHLGAGVAALTDSKEAMAAWLKYIEATVTRYKSVVNEWEIWNEPYRQEKDYAPLLMATADLVKRIQTDAIILGEIQTNPRNKHTLGMLEALKTAGKLGLVDYWAYHPYTNNPDEAYGNVEELRKLVQSYNPKYKLYQGEVGCPSILEWTHALSFHPWTEYSQAKWDLRRMAGDRVRNIPSSIFTIIDLRYTNMLQSFGLIRSNLLLEFIYKRPAFYGVQHMAGFFDDAVKPVGELEYEANAYRQLTVAGFQKNGTSVALVWYNDQIPSDELKWDLVDLTIKKATYEDPVYVEMITGKVHEIDRATWKSEGGNTRLIQLPVWDSPMMLAERAQVPLRKESKGK